MRLRGPWILIPALLLGVLLFGCGKDDGPTSVPTSTPSPQAPAVPAAAPPSEASEPAAQTSSVPSSDAALSTDLAVIVNDRALPREKLDEIKDSLFDYYRRLYAQFGQDIRLLMTGAHGRLFELDLELAALDNLIVKGLVEGEAERRGIVISEEAIEEEFEAQYVQMLESQGMTEQELVEYFESHGYDIDEFKASGRESVSDQLLYEAVQRAVAGPIDASEETLRTYFDEHRADYETGEKVEASHILVESAESAQEIVEELAVGAAFDLLASERSIDTENAARGGKLGWFGRGEMVPEFEEAAFALEPGEISNPVQSQYGYHIILVTNRREAVRPAYEEVADRVRADLEDEISEERAGDWLDNAYESAEIRVIPPVLNAAYQQRREIDAGLAAFERLRDEGSVEEKYLSFIIGSIYELKIEAAESEKAELESEASDDPERASRIAALGAAIESARVAALAAYQQALADLGGDPEVQARIDELESQTPSQTP